MTIMDTKGFLHFKFLLECIGSIAHLPYGAFHGIRWRDFFNALTVLKLTVHLADCRQR